MTAELIERLERGEVGREMDAAILPVVSYMPWTFVQWDGAGGVYRDESDRIRHMKAENIPRYTTSLDAAIALVERVRPGARWSKIGTRITLFSHPIGEVIGKGRASTPAAAMIAALLKAEAK